MNRPHATALFATDSELSRRARDALARQGKVVVFSFFPLPDSFGTSHTVPPGDIAGLLMLFRKEGINQVCLAGAISPALLFSGTIHPSGQEFLRRRRRWRSEALLADLAGLLRREGIRLVSLARLLPDDIAPAGVLTERAPTPEERTDILAGCACARSLLRFRVGQAVAVRRGMILAVEGAEGTDRMIQRAGALVEGFVVVKVAGRRKDPRFDLPAVGERTVAALADARATALAVEAGKTLLVNRNSVISACNAAGISLVGI